MIKLIIFDMDGTLYDLNDVVTHNYEMQVAFLQERWNKSREEIVTYFNENSIFPTVCKESKSATELFLRNGLSREDWNVYREKHFSADCIDLSKAVTANMIRSFANYSKLVLLSSNSYANINTILAHLNIPICFFDDVVCSDRFCGPNFNKKDAISSISDKYSVLYNEILSIGDRYSTDILPMLELGGVGVHIKSPSSLPKVIFDMQTNNLASCEEYNYYNQL